MNVISISPKRVVTRLLSLIPLLLVLQLVLRGVHWATNQPPSARPSLLFLLVQRFHFDQELSVPAWYSSSLLLVVAGLFAVIAITKAQLRDRYTPSWRGLAILFLYFSIDEASALHELAIEPLRSSFNLGGIFYFAWVVIAIPVLLILFLMYFKFLKALPQSTQRLFLLSIGLYIGGALGVELIGGYLVDLYPSNRLAFFMVATVEEVLEMLGINVLIYTLLTYIANEIGSIEFSVCKSSNKRNL